jgi:hypothetical protein
MCSTAADSFSIIARNSDEYHALPCCPDHTSHVCRDPADLYILNTAHPESSARPCCCKLSIEAFAKSTSATAKVQAKVGCFLLFSFCDFQHMSVHDGSISTAPLQQLCGKRA